MQADAQVSYIRVRCTTNLFIEKQKKPLLICEEGLFRLLDLTTLLKKINGRLD
jgi:hypothetical protein